MKIISFERCRQSGGWSRVCRFELVELTDRGHALADYWSTSRIARVMSTGKDQI